MGMGMSCGAGDGTAPAAGRRNDPWSRRSKAAFLESLAATGSVTRSALLVGQTAAAAQRLKGRDAAFAADRRVAMQAACETLEAALIEHAMGDRGAAGQGAVGDGAGEGIGDGACCPTCGQEAARPFDPVLALKVLGQRAAYDARPSRSSATVYRQVSIGEVEASLMKKIAAIKRARKTA